MIPKVIHYCWFGGNPLPESAKKCIDSWKKYCPDFEIREWNESNYNVSTCTYIEEAYNAKKWAFVSDFARFDILNTYGGLYFDTDVELIRPIDDIWEKGPFMGMEICEIGDDEVAVNPGLGMGTFAGHPLLNEMCARYRDMHFLNKDGSYNLTTIVQHTTDLLKSYGFSAENNMQNAGMFWIYPCDYFCPLDYVTGELVITPNTRSIHHYRASWHEAEEQKIIAICQNMKRRFGKKKGNTLGRILCTPLVLKLNLRTKGIKGTFLHIIKKFK